MLRTAKNQAAGPAGMWAERPSAIKNELNTPLGTHIEKLVKSPAIETSVPFCRR
jgi:hypothetical protein